MKVCFLLRHYRQENVFGQLIVVRIGGIGIITSDACVVVDLVDILDEGAAEAGCAQGDDINDLAGEALGRTIPVEAGTIGASCSDADRGRVTDKDIRTVAACARNAQCAQRGEIDIVVGL